VLAFRLLFPLPLSAFTAPPLGCREKVCTPPRWAVTFPRPPSKGMLSFLERDFSFFYNASRFSSLIPGGSFFGMMSLPFSFYGLPRLGEPAKCFLIRLCKRPLAFFPGGPAVVPSFLFELITGLVERSALCVVLVLCVRFYPLR